MRVLDRPLELPGAGITHPFGDHTNVYKVGVATATDDGVGRHAGGRVFALVWLSVEPAFVNLKVDPHRGLALRAEHSAIRPGHHMKKRHWISVYLDDSPPDGFVTELIEDSYDLVVSSLTARQRFDVDPDRFPLASTKLQQN